MITGRVIEQGANYHVQIELTKVESGEPVVSKEFDYNDITMKSLNSLNICHEGKRG